VTRHVIHLIESEKKIIQDNINAGINDATASAERVGMEYIKNLHYLKGLEFIIRVIEGDYDL
jgi:hypothetical protein